MQTMPTPLADVCCARLSAAALPVLAPVRCLAGVTVALDGDAAWVRWDPLREEVLRLLLPVVSLELFERRGNRWHRPGHRLPCDGPPDQLPQQRLDRVLVPAAVKLLPPTGDKPQRCRLTLVAADEPRPTTAVRAPLAELVNWANDATTAQLEGVRAMRHADRVFLVGRRLPPLPGGERFWGKRVFVPLGLAPQPALPESALVALLGLVTDEAAVLDAAGVEVFDAGALEPLTRARVRLAAREGVP
jgi:hypothetical protein